MKKIYEAPELELIRFRLVDVILTSPTEDLGSQIGDGDEGGGFDIGDL